MVLLSPAHAAVTKYASGGIYGMLTVQTVFTDSYPVEPGENLVISIEFKNDGTEMARNVEIELKPNFPFTLLESSKKTISRVDPNKGMIVEYDLFVDSSAVSALYTIPVEYSYDTDLGTTPSQDEIEVRVQGVPKFKLLNMTPGKELNPGNQAGISASIKNVGTGKAKRVTVTFSSSSAYIQPIFSKGTVYIENMGPNEEKNIDFEVLVDPDAEYGVYISMINISYEDESGDDFSEDFDVGILVKGIPQLQVIKTEADKPDDELKVDLINTGSAKAVGIKGELIINDNLFDIDYITQIKIDKQVTMKFRLPPKSNAELRLSYEGPDNEEYSQEETIAWKVPFSLPSWVIVLGIVVVGFFVFKKKLWKKIL